MNGFSFINNKGREINELLKFQSWAVTEFMVIDEKQDRSLQPEVKLNLRKSNGILCQASDLTDTAIDKDIFLDQRLAFRKDFNKLCL